MKHPAAVIAIVLALASIAAVTRADEVSEGRALYMRYCASCHGVKGDGRGPVAKALSKQPSDLTKLGEKYGMPLPAGQLARFIDGRTQVAAHGEREMPVWGQRFGEVWKSKGSREGSMDERIRKIVAFLNAIQSRSLSPEAPPSPVGRSD